jgi:DNA-directed RNA polymerase specialized sigma24 family protein
LEALDPRKAKLVELRYFLGCSNQECCGMLEVSLGTIERDLRLARSWLYARLHPEAGNCE